jgi:hypothetical protein
MINRLLLVLLSGLLLVLPASGCITDDSKTTVSPITNDIATMKVQIATHGTDISKLRDYLSKKADSTRVDALAGTGGGTAGYSKAETYTQQQVNDAITTAITALKNNSDQSWIKVTPANLGANPNVPLINAGDYSYRIYQKPASPVYAGGQSYSWALEITNNTAKWKKVQIGGTLNPDTTVAGSGILTAWNNNYVSPSGTYFNCLNYVLATTNPTGVMPTYVTPGTPTPSVMFGTPGSNGSIFTFGAGEKKLIWISLNLIYASGVTQWLDPSWNISLSD